MKTPHQLEDQMIARLRSIDELNDLKGDEELRRAAGELMLDLQHDIESGYMDYDHNPDHAMEILAELYRRVVFYREKGQNL